MYQIYFILEWHSTCSRRSFRPSSRVKDCTYSNQTDTAVCRQQYLFHICLLLYVQSWTSDEGRKHGPKHVKCLRLMWPCNMNVGWRERNQQDATNLMFIIKYLSQHVSGIIMPIISRTVTFTVHAARVPAPHNHSHDNQCRTTYAAVHTLVLLMMGIMMPETCWDKSLIINNRLVVSCWSLSLHPTFMLHGHKSQKLDVFSCW